MPTHRQGTVNPPVTDRALGRAGTHTLKSIFTQSPIHTKVITEEGLREEYQNTVLDATINDGGHTFGTFDTGFSGAPDLAEVETGGAGAPASPYVPNPTSPGPGSVNANDQAEAPDGYGETANSQWGSGVGSALGPKESSAKISSQKLGDYVMGKATRE